MTDSDETRDPRIDALWRKASAETPPPALDAAILAAARREVDAGPRSVDRAPDAHDARANSRGARRATAWWFPLAAVATLGALALGILQLATPDRVAPDPATAVVSDMPAKLADRAGERVKTAAAPSNAAAQKVGSDSTFAAKPTADAGASVNVSESKAEPALRESKEEAMAAPPVPAAAVAQPAAPAAASAAAGSLARSAGASGIALKVAPEAVSMRADRAPPLPVPEWVALIRRLRDEGRTSEVKKELDAFRAAHADADQLLPADLRDLFPRER